MIDGEHTILDGNYDYLKPYYDIILDEQENGVCQDYATLKTSNLHYSGAFSQGNVGMMNMGTWFISTLIDKAKIRRVYRLCKLGYCKVPSSGRRRGRFYRCPDHCFKHSYKRTE